MAQFPQVLTLEDTGERRWPKRGEIYMWAHPDNGDIDGPHYCFEDDEESWYGGPECFAIMQPVSSLMEPAKHCLALSSVRAVLHQMTHGEASDFIDADTEPFDRGTVGAEENEARRDLQWCRTQLKEAITNLS